MTRLVVVAVFLAGCASAMPASGTLPRGTPGVREESDEDRALLRGALVDRTRRYFDRPMVLPRGQPMIIATGAWDLGTWTSGRNRPLDGMRLGRGANGALSGGTGVIYAASATQNLTVFGRVQFERGAVANVMQGSSATGVFLARLTRACDFCARRPRAEIGLGFSMGVDHGRLTTNFAVPTIFRIGRRLRLDGGVELEWAWSGSHGQRALASLDVPLFASVQVGDLFFGPSSGLLVDIGGARSASLGAAVGYGFYVPDSLLPVQLLGTFRFEDAWSSDSRVDPFRRWTATFSVAVFLTSAPSESRSHP